MRVNSLYGHQVMLDMIIIYLPTLNKTVFKFTTWTEEHKLHTYSEKEYIIYSHIGVLDVCL